MHRTRTDLRHTHLSSLGLAAVAVPFLLIAAGCSAPGRAARDGRSGGAATFAEFERRIERLRRDLKTPAMSGAVALGGKVVWAKGYGYADVEERVPATPETSYHLASLTKTFAATVLMQLVEEGKLDLDEPVARYGVAIPGPHAIRVRHLLTHTSEGVPGEAFNYNGNRFAELDKVIIGASGRTFGELLVERIIRPLELKHTAPNPKDSASFALTGLDSADFLRGVARPYEVRRCSGSATLGEYPRFFATAGGLLSSATDVVTYSIALDEDRLLKPETIAKMFTPAVSASGRLLPYRLGWFVKDYCGVRIVWHYGWWTCNSSLIIKVPERGATFVLLSNTDALSRCTPGLAGGELLNSEAAREFLAAFVFHEGEATRPGIVAVATRTASREAGDDEGEARKKDQLDFEWLPFPDDAKFRVLGLYWSKENRPQLWRMPKGRLATLPNGVQRRSKAPAGGRILLRCDTTKLGLKVTPTSKGSHKGFDVYINGRFFRSAVAELPGVESDVVLFTGLGQRQKEIVIYLPYDQEVMIESVGVDRNARFDPPEHKYARPLPVVFYGSSVCQGSGASRPGMTYEAILCRELDLDFVNLGFGGAGKAEKAVVDLVNSVAACCYVFDLGKSYGMQDKAAYKVMLQAVRKKHPDMPIICITPITSALEVRSEEYSSRSVHTRVVVRDVVNELIASGEKRVYLIEGTDLLGFDEHDGLSKDGVHPSDSGCSIIARKLVPAMRKAIGLHPEGFPGE